MAGKFKIFKVLALPDPLEASSVYYVLENDRVTKYVTNKDGTIVAKTSEPMLAGDNISLLNNDAGFIAETFEVIAKNLKAYPFVLNYTGENLTSVVYTLPAAQSITKTLNYTGDNLTSVVLSGDTPVGIELTKTLSYTGDNLTGVAYS